MKITIEKVLSDEAISALYPTYVLAWAPLLTEAAARHVLTAEEFAKEMNDPRVEKFLVSDEAGRAIALTTMTRDLSTIDWINGGYYAARYPDAVAGGSMFYLGYTLVDVTRRRSSALLLMAAEINRRVAQAKGVVGFDICGYNNVNGIGRHTAWLFRSSDQIEALDTQTYYAADYRGIVDESTTANDPHRLPTVTMLPAEGARPALAAVSEDVRVVTLADHPDAADDISGVLASRWPTFMLAGVPSHDVDLEELLVSTPENQVLLLDSNDVVIGVGLSVPLAWDGTVADLPKGWDDAIRRSARQRADGTVLNTTCAVSITISPTAARRGLAVTLLTALKQVAQDCGSRALLAPIRPISKSDYPLTAMEDYLEWQTEDGRIFDPWLRMHVRSGGEILAVAPASMTISGSIDDWQGWLQSPLPGSGEFVITGGLTPLTVDTESGRGVYVEPNVWIAHQLSPPD